MRFLKGLLMITLFLGVMSIHGVEVGATSEDFSDIADIIDEMMEEKIKDNHIPNAVVTVVHKGDVIFKKGYGNNQLASGNEVDPNTSLFRIGSISKLFTWTAIMQLVEEGILDLDADVNDYIDFNIPEGPRNSGPITLRHLLTHTPGFEDYPNAIFRLEADAMLPLSEYAQEFLPVRVFPAGEVTAYSNYGTTLAGYIVEQTSGLDFNEYIEANIFEPLQMENSTFQQPLPASIRKNMAQPYRYISGEFLAGEFEYLPGPAGGMSSSGMDMAKFIAAMLEKDSGVLRPLTIEEMHRQQFTSHASLDGMTLGYMERTINDKRIISHAGSTLLYDSGLYLLPEAELGVFIAYSGGDYTLHTKVFHDLMEYYYPTPQSDSPKSIPGVKERAKEFTGEYHQNRRSFTTSDKFVSLMSGIIRVGISESGNLLVTHMGIVNPFVEVEAGIYQNLNDVEQLDPYGEFATIVFETAANGEVTLMTDGPMSYSKAPWYSTSGFTFLSLIGAIIIIIGSTLFWIVSAGVKRMKRRKDRQSKLGRLARGLAVITGMLTIVLLLGFLLNGELNPVYGLPKSSYTEEPAWMILFDFIPYIIGAFSIILVIFTGAIWWKKYMRITNRIHYTIFVMMTLLLNWLFYYWNIY